MDADDHPENSQSRKSNALPKDGNGSQSSFSHLPPPPTPREFILSVASKIASQPLQNYGSNVWGVLTAISDNARKRQQVSVHPLLEKKSDFSTLHSDVIFW